MSEFQNISSFVLFLNQPVFHVVGFAFALKIELYIVQGVAYLLEWRFWVEVGIARGQHLTDIAQTPPLALLCFLGAAEGLANHLNQIVQLLERLVLSHQLLNLIIVQPKALTFIK